MSVGIPIFAILKIICTRFFNWFKRNSTWYDEEDIDEMDAESEDKPTPKVLENENNSKKIHK